MTHDDDIISLLAWFCLLKVSTSCREDSSANQSQVALILSEAFQSMRAELNCLPLAAPSMLGEFGESKMAALLEEYSLLLLQAVERRLAAPAHHRHIPDSASSPDPASS